MSDPLDEMAQRFLSWPLPADVCADAVACKQGAPHRTGTNLLTAAQARQMIEHVCAAALAAKDAEIAENERGWQRTYDHDVALLKARAEKAEAEAAGLRADAERYRVARAKVCIVGDAFHVINLRPTYVAPDAAIEFDAAIDAARGG